MRTIALFTLMLGLVAIPASAAGLLDGKTFSGLSGPKGKALTDKDDLVFADGKLHSTGCDAYGFTPGSYTAVQKGDAISFTATTTSPSHGTIEWEGTVRDGKLEATFVWKTWLVIRKTYSIEATQK